MRERFQRFAIGIFFLSLLCLLTFLFTSAWAQTAPVIKIGCSSSLTGKVSKEGWTQKQGQDLWAWWCNEKMGGINIKGVKHKVELKSYDDQSSAEKTVKLIEKLIAEDGIKLLISPYSSGLVFAGSAVSEKYKALMINIGGAAEEIHGRGFKYLFSCYGTSRTYLKAPLAMAAELVPRPKTVAVIWENELHNQDSVDGALAKCNELGFQVVFKGMYPQGTQDISTLITNVKAKNPDIFIVAGHFTDSILAVRQTKEFKFNPKLMMVMIGPIIPDYPKVLGKDAEYSVSQAFWTPAVRYKDPIWGSAEVFTQEFIKRYHTDPDYLAANGGMAGTVLQMAMEKAGSTDPTVLRDTISQMDLPSTLVGPLKFNAEGTNAKAAIIVVQIQNGKPVEVYPQAAATAKLIYPKPAWE